MTTTTTLLDQWKIAEGITSDNAAAIRLGISRATISKWRSDGSGADADVAEKMAQGLGLNPLAVVAKIQSERGGRAEVSAFWKRVAKSMMMVCLAVYTAKSGIAKVPYPADFNDPSPVYYVKLHTIQQ